MKANVRAILFDFDGVIVESLAVKEAAFAALFEFAGADVVRRVVGYHRSHLGVSRVDKFRHFYRCFLGREVGDARLAELCARFAARVQSDVAKCPSVKGVERFLETYAAKLGCHVVSATPRDELVEIVRERGLARHFQSVHGAPTRKVDAVARILREFGYAREEAVFIGDARSDYEAALENRVGFIARCDDRDDEFRGIDCPRIADLTTLPELLAAS